MKGAGIILSFVVYSALTVFSALQAQDLDYLQLKSLIRDNNIRSIDQLLETLPLEYKKHYTFIYESRSRQRKQITPAHPRVLVTGPTAQLVLGFTKSPDDVPKGLGSNILEVMEWLPEQKRFRFFEIDFSTGAVPLEKDPVFNPPHCVNCHDRQSPAPIWDPYNTWAGVYGSLSRLGCDLIVKGTPEWRFYQIFKTENRQQGRYQHLPEEIRAKDCPYDETEDGDFTVGNAANSDPNSLLTRLLMEKSLQRAAQYIYESPKYPAFKYLLRLAESGSFQNIREIQLALPEPWKSELPPFIETVKTLHKQQFESRVQIFNKANSPSKKIPERAPGDFQSENGLEHVGAFAFVMKLMEIPMYSITMAFSNGTYDFSSPDVNKFHVLLATLNVLMTKDPELAGFEWEPLIQKSLSALKTADQPKQKSK